MLKFGFVGLGQAGGLFAEQAKKEGHQVLSINTANIDLEALTTLSPEEKFHLSEFEGAGKDRTIGKEAYELYRKDVFNNLQKSLNGCHVIFPITSLGGGTGSGIIPALIKDLATSFPNSCVCPILFLPSQDESARTKMNALECFAELASFDDYGATFLYDLQRFQTHYRNTPILEMFEYERKQFFNMLAHFKMCTEKTSRIASLDMMDILTLFSERGNATWFGIKMNEIVAADPEKFSQKLRTTYEKDTCFSATDIGSLTRAAITIETPNALTDKLKVDAVFSQFATPLEIFSGIYVEGSDVNANIFLTGLSFPHSRLRELEKEVRENEKSITSNLINAAQQNFSVNQSWSNSVKRRKKINI